jgi:transposase
MAQGKSRDPRKEQQWRRWVQQWQHSGLSVRDFCARHDLAEPSFYAWRRQLQQRQAPARFVPVRVVVDEAPARDGSVEVVLTCGRRVRVPPGFDPATLQQLLAVLAEVPPC